MTLSIADRAIQTAFPSVVAPIEGLLPAPAQHGVRYVLGSQGLFRELSTAWMTTTCLLAPAALPYGDVQTGVVWHVRPPAMALFNDFVAHARKSLPNEAAGLLVLNTQTLQWSMRLREATYVSPDRIDYVEVDLADDELGVIDIHSHGSVKAFFSTLDDHDDAGGIKIAAVVGHVHTAAPQLIMRLCALDRFHSLTMKDDQFALVQPHEALHAF